LRLPDPPIPPDVHGNPQDSSYPYSGDLTPQLPFVHVKPRPIPYKVENNLLPQNGRDILGRFGDVKKACSAILFLVFRLEEIIAYRINEYNRFLEDALGLFHGQRFDDLVIRCLAEIKRLMKALRQFLWENVLAGEFSIKDADHSSMLGGDRTKLLKKGKGGIEHPIVGAIDDALRASLMLAKNTGVV
jgi:hypothetical protein